MNQTQCYQSSMATDAVATPLWQIITGFFGIQVVVQSFFQERMKRASEREKTKFSWVHEKKANALVEIYQCIQDINIGLKKLKIVDTLFTDLEIIEHEREIIFEDMKKFSEALKVNRLVLPKKSVATLEKCEKIYSESMFHFEPRSDLNELENRGTLITTNYDTLIETALLRIEDEYKILPTVEELVRKEFGTDESLLERIINKFRK